MKLKFFYLFFIFIFIISGCNSKKLALLPQQGTILAFGDSLTIGKGVDIAYSYPSVLAELSGRKVINAGITGEVSSQGLLRLEKVLKDIKPDFVVLLEGGNDILQNKDLTLTKGNLSKMIELIMEKNIPVILVGVPNKTLSDNSAKIYYELSKEYKLLLEDSIIKKLLINPQYKSDEHHFNKKGYHLLAESIYKILQNNGAI